jgi:hypothetical protein
MEYWNDRVLRPGTQVLEPQGICVLDERKVRATRFFRPKFEYFGTSLRGTVLNFKRSRGADDPISIGFWIFKRHGAGI